MHNFFYKFIKPIRFKLYWLRCRKIIKKKIQFSKGEWLGNHWPSIDVFTSEFGDYNPELFKLIYDYFCINFTFNIRVNGIKTIFDVPVDRYFADFEIFSSQVSMDMDGFQFSIAFEQIKIRDLVYEEIIKLEKCFVNN